MQKIKKKILSIVIALAILMPFFGVRTISSVDAKEMKHKPLLMYSANEETKVNINDRNTRLNADKDVDKIKDLKSVTVTLEFKISGNPSHIHNLIYIGKNGSTNQYLNVYAIPNTNTIGIEIRDNDKFKFNDKTTFNANIADGNWHKFAFTIFENDRYQLNVDGQYEGKKWTRNPTFWANGIGVEPDLFSFGGGLRSGNSYTMNGSLKNVKVFDRALSDEDVNSSFDDIYVENNMDTLFKGVNYDLTKESSREEDTSLELKNRESVTVLSRFKLENPENNDKQSLLTLNKDDNKSEIYLKAKENKLVYKTAEDEIVEINLGENAISNSRWHSLAMTIGKSGNRVSLDGKTIKVEDENNVLFSNDKNSIDKILVGENFIGGIDLLEIFGDGADQDLLNSMTALTNVKAKLGPNPQTTLKTDSKPLFYPGLDSPYYRIPSLITTKKGTIIAGADKRNTTEMDWGDIDAVIRRKEKGQDKFDELINVIDLDDNGNPVFVIDMVLLPVMEGKHAGRVYMLIDMFPVEGSYWASTHKTGYKTIDGNKYQILEKDGKEYTVREKGIVYDPDNNPTEYKVVVNDLQPFSRLGELYKDNERIGNIYRGDAGFKVQMTPYLWLTYSDDDGKTSTQPRDITAKVKD